MARHPSTPTPRVHTCATTYRESRRENSPGSLICCCTSSTSSTNLNQTPSHLQGRPPSHFFFRLRQSSQLRRMPYDEVGFKLLPRLRASSSRTPFGRRGCAAELEVSICNPRAGLLLCCRSAMYVLSSSKQRIQAQNKRKSVGWFRGGDGSKREKRVGERRREEGGGGSVTN